MVIKFRRSSRPNRRNDDSSYFYTIKSNLPLGLTVTDDYGNLVIEAYGTGSDMREGESVMQVTDGWELNHRVTLSLDLVTDEDDELPPPSPPRLRIVK